MSLHYTVEVRNTNLPKRAQRWDSSHFGDAYPTKGAARRAIRNCIHFEGIEYRVVPWKRKRVELRFDADRREL